jgi:hypothetical protein
VSSQLSSSLPTREPLIIAPIISGECSTIEASLFFGQTDLQLRTCADVLLDGVDAASLEATVDGVGVPGRR